jgi:hypothetical protein
MLGADVVRQRAAGMFVLRPRGGRQQPRTETDDGDNE